MFLQRCSSIAIARARCYSSTTSPISTSLSIISKHIQDLSKKHDHLLQMRRDLRGVKIQNLNPVQRELFESHPRVLHQLNFLQKFYKEIAPAVVNLDGSTADAPITLTSSVPVVPTSHSSQCPVSIIFKELLDLHQQCVSISQIEQSIHTRLSQLTTAQLGFHCTKFSVMHKINVLSKVFEEITWEIELDCSRNAEPSRGDFGDQLNPVMSKSSRLAEIITSDHSTTDTTPMLQNLGLGPSMKKEMDFKPEPLEKNRYASTISTTSSALNVIYKHIQDLSIKYDHIVKMRRYLHLHKIPILNLVQREVLRTQPRIVHQLDILCKLYKEIAQAGQLQLVKSDGSTTDARGPITLNSSVSIKTTTHPSHCPLSIILKQLQELHRNLFVISQIKESLYPCVSLDLQQRRVLGTNSSVVHHINVLTKVLEEIAWEIELDSSRNTEPRKGGFDDQFKNIMTPKSRRLAEMVPYRSRTESIPLPQKQSVRQFKATLNQGVEPSMEKNEMALNYLLISNGYEIHCLDLNQRRFLSSSMTGNAQLLPITATLNLLEENLPTTVALFRWRSNAYMIGGLKLPKALKEGDHIYSNIRYWGCKPPDISPNPYISLCFKDGVKPTSCFIHGLSLDDTKSSLLYSESNMGKLKKPKNRPIVEEINGEIHVIDTPVMWVPKRNWCISSHEVLDRDTGGWVEEIQMLENFVIMSYLVVGQNIYAIAADDAKGFLVFDSKKKKWDFYSRTQWEVAERRRCPMFRDVWDILQKWYFLSQQMVVSCVGGFPYGDVGDPLYILISMNNDDGETDMGICAQAYLVNSSGRILCIQPLLHIIKWVRYMTDAKITKVEEEDKLRTKKTICSVVNGFTWESWEFCPIEMIGTHVFINIFTVEELPDVADKVREVAVKGSDPVELEFVRVDVIDKQAYTTDRELFDGGCDNWEDLQVCLL